MFFPKVDDELAELVRHSLQRRNHSKAVATAARDVADAAVSVTTKFPWLPAGAVVALAQSRKGAEAPEAIELARRSALDLVRSPQGWNPFGAKVKAHELKGKRFNPANLAALVSERERAFDVAGQRERFKEEQGYLPEDKAAFEEETAIFYGDLAARYTSTDPGVLQEMARLRIRPGTPEANEIAKRFPSGTVTQQEKTKAALAEVMQGPQRTEFSEEEEVELRRSGFDFTVGQYPQEARVTNPLVPVARTAGMALAAPAQELQGLFRNVVSDIGNLAGGDTGLDLSKFTESQSDLGIAADALFAGDEVDVGSGFLVDPESEVAKERVRRERERGTIGGHAITLGRWTADLVTEPGSIGFNVLSGLIDAGVQIKADPSALVLTKAGAVNAARKVVRHDQVDAWLTSKTGRQIIDYLAGETSFDQMWRRTGKKIPVDILNKLVDAENSDEVTNVLRGVLGPRLRDWPELKKAPPARYVRLGEQMPAARIDLEDVDDAVEQVDRYLRNAKIPTERIAELTGRMARSAGDRHEQYRVVMDMVTEVNDGLRAAGLDETQITRLSKLWVDAHEGNRLYFIKELGENADFPGSVVDGALGPKPQPHLFTEVVGRFVPLPDLKNVRAIRRSVSPYTKLLAKSKDVRQLRLPLAAAEFFTNDVWKPSVLLRLAYPVRVVGEEQFRMAASGLNSMFNHPISYIAYAVGRKSGADVFDTAWDDIEQFRNALTREGAGFHDPAGAHRSRHWDPISRGEEEYTGALGDELGQIYSDPVAQRILNADDVDNVKAWFRTGDGAKVRLQMAKTNKALADARNADAYIDSVVERIHIKTAGDSRLVTAVREGKLNGVRISDDGATLNRKFVDELQKVVDEGVGPEKVKGQIVDYFSGAGERWNRAVEQMFTYLMGKPTNWLSRSPTFQQFYWKRMEEMFPYLDDATRSKVLAGVKRSKIKFNPAKGDADLKIGLDEADAWSKAWALDGTQKLLYSLAERSQFFDATRIIFPFGEAWKEMFTRWGQIAVERPQTLRRAQQGMEAARDVGFFQEDPVTGDEIFVYPGTAWLNERLLGVPVPLTGRVQGLSLMTEVIPGLGPAVQIPVGFLFDTPMLDKPEFDWAKDILLPFGEVTSPTELKNWAPAWLEKFITGAVPVGDQRRLLANTTADLATYLASTGKYDLHGPDAEEQMDRLWRDAKKKARTLYFIRGVAQLGAPSAPTPQMVVEDKAGNVQVLAVLRKEYIEAVQNAKGDSDVATAAFLKKYGEDAFLVMQSKSYGVVFGVPVSGEGLDWMRKNQDLEKRYPHTFGYFAPVGDPDDFDYNAYVRQFEKKQRHALTVEQYTKLGNARVGSFLYRRAQARVGDSPSDEQRAWLRQVKGALRDEFPGFDEIETLGLPSRPKKEQVIRELQRAAKDPKVLGTPAGKALEKYLKARQMAAEQGNTPTSFISSKSMRPTRDWLRRIGEALSNETPEFSSLWDFVLSDEMEDDLEEE